jgi:hypothetical protein
LKVRNPFPRSRPIWGSFWGPNTTMTTTRTDQSWPRRKHVSPLPGFHFGSVVQNVRLTTRRRSDRECRVCDEAILTATSRSPGKVRLGPFQPIREHAVHLDVVLPPDFFHDMIELSSRSTVPEARTVVRLLMSRFQRNRVGRTPQEGSASPSCFGRGRIT